MVTTAKLDEAPATHVTMSFDEAMAQYDGQWLLLRVVNVDEYQLPSEVQVMAAGPDEASACRAFTNLVSPSDQPIHPYYVTQAYRHIRSGEEAQRAIQEATARADEGTLGAWHRR
jgi:hypothetical protein